METGARAALPIWLEFMQKAVAGTSLKSFSVPEAVVFAKIDMTTGKPATLSTEKAIFEAFKEGTAPTDSANVAGGAGAVDGNTPTERFFEMDRGLATEGKPNVDSSEHEKMD